MLVSSSISIRIKISVFFSYQHFQAYFVLFVFCCRSKQKVNSFIYFRSWYDVKSQNGCYFKTFQECAELAINRVAKIKQIPKLTAFVRTIIAINTLRGEDLNWFGG